MSTEEDVTLLFESGNPDDESLPILKCACGMHYSMWDFQLSIYKDDPSECPFCHRKFYFRQSIRIIEVIE